MTSIIQEKLPEIDSEKLFQLLKSNNVSRAYLFGSITTPKFNKVKSDIDIMIELRHDERINCPFWLVLFAPCCVAHHSGSFGYPHSSRLAWHKNYCPIIEHFILSSCLIEMPPLEKGETLIRLWEQLEEFFERKVDLVTDQPIKNPYFRRSVEETKVLIYDREGEKIFV